MTDGPRGSTAWREWQAWATGASGDDRFEAALYSDAEISGSVREGFGPFALLNPSAPASGDHPALVLRASSHTGAEFIDPSRASETDSTTFHGGDLIDEVAALLSLALGIRCVSGGLTRMWGFGDGLDPLGLPLSFFQRVPRLPSIGRRGPVIPSLRRRVEVTDAVPILETFNALTPEQSVALVRAARLYQQAVWVADDDANQAWLQLVSALEAAAPHRRSTRSHLERLRDHWPELAELLEEAGHNHADRVARMLGDSARAQRRILEFLDDHMPPPPATRPHEWAQVDWSELRSHLKLIYQYRSRALHDGTPFPEPMMESPSVFDGVASEKPTGLATSAKGSVWLEKDTPMLLATFEYIVRRVLLGWWAALAKL